VLHAGVPRLISEAWTQSGMENRAPISTKTASQHIIHFEKLSKEHASLLLKKYLFEYRTEEMETDLFPFTEEAVSQIGTLAEYNAAKILKMAYDLLDKAATIEEQIEIDYQFVREHTIELQQEVGHNSLSAIESAETIDLYKKAGS